MEDYGADNARPGEPKDPIEQYDAEHGHPCEEDVSVTPPNVADPAHKSYNVR